MTIYFPKMPPPCSEGRKLLVRIWAENLISRTRPQRAAWRNKVVSKSQHVVPRVVISLVSSYLGNITTYTYFFGVSVCLWRSTTSLPFSFFRQNNSFPSLPRRLSHSAWSTNIRPNPRMTYVGNTKTVCFSPPSPTRPSQGRLFKILRVTSHFTYEKSYQRK